MVNIIPNARRLRRFRRWTLLIFGFWINTIINFLKLRYDHRLLCYYLKIILLFCLLWRVNSCLLIECELQLIIRALHIHLLIRSAPNFLVVLGLLILITISKRIGITVIVLLLIIVFLFRLLRIIIQASLFQKLAVSRCVHILRARYRFLKQHQFLNFCQSMLSLSRLEPFSFLLPAKFCMDFWRSQSIIIEAFILNLYVVVVLFVIKLAEVNHSIAFLL